MSSHGIRSDSFEGECRVFTEHLLGCAPDPYVVRKYAEAHRLGAVFSTGSRFDLFLVNVATRHRALAKLVDSYARIFFPAALIRKKLVLLLAILETSAPSFKLMDAVVAQNKAVVLARLCGSGMIYLLNLVLATILFLPVQITFRVMQRIGRPSLESAPASTEFTNLTPTTIRERRES